MELRADVVASSWAGGPKSGTHDRRRSDHPPFRDRRSRAFPRLAQPKSLSGERARGASCETASGCSPKLRYFALSLILSIMQPLNGAVFAYFPQQLALLSVGAMGTAQMVAAIIMIAHANRRVRRIGALRMAVVAATTTTAAACSQINFERTTVAFFLFSELAAFPLPGEAEPAATVHYRGPRRWPRSYSELMEAAFRLGPPCRASRRPALSCDAFSVRRPGLQRSLEAASGQSPFWRRPPLPARSRRSRRIGRPPISVAVMFCRCHNSRSAPCWRP